ncbi:uncharacterized protein Z520_05230 [Fonsecaea multimorphosa CBS 102226]|uniref:Uncharacterized protein n=1 Tax=Fonsecaea multimorphosa CBS 102226 TaxID=1442371 RepID=A0A0D2K6G1_9EURO|nr:uncharacterized protein Z520_05230 [Fonsecaea multimorphosa CBS 102226]KIX98769.1 hypothetical protein Z520_05230 [Fonsecaea multimorphosa CBS 102226]OAL25050.1 hypothetical protein AYO22_04927 [Fonsecaea multimorphosa]
MVKYTPPPEDLSRLNPIQRYMQKGQLDKQDYVYLCLFVLVYFIFRPKIEEFFKWWMSPKGLQEGEEALAAYKQKAKVGPNVIRGTESRSLETIPEISADTATGTNMDKKGKVVNRKTKEKSGEEKLLDWEDEPERKPTEGDKSDIVAWLDKWSNEE